MQYAFVSYSVKKRQIALTFLYQSKLFQNRVLRIRFNILQCLAKICVVNQLGIVNNHQSKKDAVKLLFICFMALQQTNGIA